MPKTNEAPMGQLIELGKNKIFTLKQARELLPIIQRITKDAALLVERLQMRIEAVAPEPYHKPAYEIELNVVVEKWSQKIAKLGCDPKGIWLVDFDNGDGYYCWSYPEEDLSFYHTYDGAFAGRTPIL